MHKKVIIDFSLTRKYSHKSSPRLVIKYMARTNDVTSIGKKNKSLISASQRQKTLLTLTFLQAQRDTNKPFDFIELKILLKCIEMELLPYFLLCPRLQLNYLLCVNRITPYKIFFNELLYIFFNTTLCISEFFVYSFNICFWLVEIKHCLGI